MPGIPIPIPCMPIIGFMPSPMPIIAGFIIMGFMPPIPPMPPIMPIEVLFILDGCVCETEAARWAIQVAQA
jgi:hypothetical protein